MRRDDLARYLNRQPFQPFRLYLSTGAFWTSVTDNRQHSVPRLSPSDCPLKEIGNASWRSP